MQSTYRFASVLSLSFATAALTCTNPCLAQSEAPAASGQEPVAAPAKDPRLEGLPPFLIPVPAGTVEMGLTAPQAKDAACQTAFPSKPEVALKVARKAVETSIRRSLPALGRVTVDVEEFLLARWPVKNSEYEILVAQSRAEGSRVRSVIPPFHWWAYGCPDDYTKRLPEINQRFPANDLGPKFYWIQEGAKLPYKLVDVDGNSIADHPVSNVSYIDANEVAARLGMRLPTEAEHTRAARGDTKKIWPWGDTFQGQKDLEQIKIGRAKDRHPKPVGSVEATTGPFGHLDMYGCIWQFVTGPGFNPINGNDVFKTEFETLRKDKVGSLVGVPPAWRNDRSKVIARGGSFLSGQDPIQLLIDQRAPLFSNDVLDGVGFRLAKSLRPGYDTIFSRLRGTFSKGRFQQGQEVDLEGQCGAERYELAANGFPKGYKTVSFAPLNWLSGEKSTNLRKLFEQSHVDPLLLGVLVTSEPILGKKMKDNIFSLLYRKDGIPKVLKDALKRGYQEVQLELKRIEREKKRNKGKKEGEPAKDDDKDKKGKQGKKNDWAKVLKRFGLTRKDLEPKGSDKLDYIRIDGVKVPTDVGCFLLHSNDAKIVAAIPAPKLAPKKGKGSTTLTIADNGEGKLRAKFELRIPMTSKNPSSVLDIDFHLELDCEPPTAEKPWRLPDANLPKPK